MIIIPHITEGVTGFVQYGVTKSRNSHVTRHVTEGVTMRVIVDVTALTIVDVTTRAIVDVTNSRKLSYTCVHAYRSKFNESVKKKVDVTVDVTKCSNFDERNRDGSQKILKRNPAMMKKFAGCRDLLGKILKQNLLGSVNEMLLIC